MSSQTYLRSCESFSASADRPCPICLFSAADARSLHSHIALHLERLSLFSLPRGAGDDEKDDVGSDVAVDAVQHSRGDESELSVDIGDEWDNLEEAVRMGDVERIEYILRDQATETDSHSTKLDNALIEAAKTGDIDVVETLLKHGATVRAPRDVYDDTALMAAASQNHSDVVSLLLQHGADVDACCGARTALSVASECGQLEAARTLIEHGADVNFQIEGLPIALEAAAAQNEVDVAKVLIENGADLNLSGQASLDRASASGHLEMVNFLLTAGIPTVGNEEHRPLHSAADCGHDKVVARLLEAGADVNARAIDGRTALHDAVTSGNSRCVQLLLEAGADPNATNGLESPLHLASRYGHEEAVKLLIAAGADLEITNRVSGTALQTAAKAGHSHIVDTLQTAGARTQPEEYSMSGLMGEHLSAASHASKPQPADVPRPWDVRSDFHDADDLNLTLLHDISQDSMVACVNFSENGKYIIIGCRQRAKIFEVDDISDVIELRHDVQADADVYVRSACFSPDNRMVATAADDSSVLLWDFDTRKLNSALMEGDGIGTYHVAFSPDGKKVAMACGDGTVQLYSIEDLNRQWWKFDAGVAALAFSPDALLLAVGTLDNHLFLTEPGDAGQQPCRLEKDEHQDSVISVAFSSNSRKVFTGSLDCTVKSWEIVEVAPAEIKYQTLTMPGHEDYVLSVAELATTDLVVSGSRDRTIRIWDSETGDQRVLLKGHKNSVVSVATCPTRKLIASGSADMTFTIWRYD
ncbi:general transcription repressor [Exophiala dermatitidis]|nr:general transcription repressor [Exophiala dermatitidis]KAJ4575723.1 general transcription repressor [Exophiala dermatitidis]KAJ4575977.1 general transcription repressor [Exophiala dermatitidis]KAJ4616081.1 general transcription repressor [Exophiala dermatitidis]KAJ4620471.1 general transcription repressor [Exophiala dermatitidis]